MKIISLLSPDYRSNSFLLTSNDRCAVVDPGQPLDIYQKAFQSHGVLPDMIILTHAHFDHIFSLDALRDMYSVPVYVHEDESDSLADSEKNAYSSFFGGELKMRPADFTFNENTELEIAGEKIKILHTPGHTAGSSCFLTGNALITGDTLFSDSVGRTDLYGGDQYTLLNSLKILRKIPDARNITIYPGHGPTETLSNALDNVFY